MGVEEFPTYFPRRVVDVRLHMPPPPPPPPPERCYGCGQIGPGDHAEWAVAPGEYFCWDCWREIGRRNPEAE